MTRSDLALAALATAAVPGMQPVSVVGVRPSHARARYRTAVVGDATGRRWLVRAPRDRGSGAELERNDGLVRLLGRHVPFKVPAAAGYADSQHGRAAVYPFVEGRPLRLRSLPPGPGLAAAVGRAIAAVHNIPRELFEETGAPVFDAAGYRNRLLAELDRAAETGHVPTGLLARWEEALEAAPLWQFATTPTHGSLDGSSFLVAFTSEDAASGRVVALTGWERAQVADPADDFAMLVHQASPPALEAVLDSYTLARSQRPDPHLVARARLAAEMRLVHGLATAVWAEDEEEVDYRADQLRKLDRLTSVDDSLVPRTVLAGGAAPYDAEAATEPAGETTDAPVTDLVREDATVTAPESPSTSEEASPGSLVDRTAAEQQAHPAQQPATGAAPVDPPAEEESEITTEIPVIPPGGEGEDRDLEAASPDDPAGVEALPDQLPDEPSEAATVPAEEPAEEPSEEPAWEVSPPEPGPATASPDEDVPVTDIEDEQPAAEPAPGQPEADSGPDVPENDGASDESATERLHTLYGMPVPEDADASEDGPGSTEAGDEAEGDEDGPPPGRGGTAS
ncbi:phosphotransferase [Ornithinicoccus halotolerans]|uniref:phosphotransferase n=1 Tax=Ornithinicoccus halotolerans TaxID=1748220 RepID=UPI0012978D4C|nr:phosphotransferase [Ornithinicoccus halotolerans]